MDKFQRYSKKSIFFYDEAVPELLARAIQEHRNVKVVADFGAGDGGIFHALSRRGYINGAKMIAIDLSPERCERLRALEGLQVICSDVTRVDELEDSSVDFIISTQVIEHVDEKKLLDEIKRVLAPGGQCYIASLISEHGGDKNYMLKYGWRYGWRFHKSPGGHYFVDPTHLREYRSLDEYRKVFSDNGMRVIESGKYELKVSLLEFLFRRILRPVLGLNAINDVFVRFPVLGALKSRLSVQPPGYYICEVVVERRQ